MTMFVPSTRPLNRIRISGRVVLASHPERKLHFCTDIEKSVLINNFEKRSWSAVGADDEWHFYWACMNTCRSIFSVESGYRMNDNQ